MNKAIAFHVGGNQYAPLPTTHHTYRIWEELSQDFDEYHVFARSKSWRFSHTQQGNVHLHLVPGLTGRMTEFFFSSWMLPWYVRKYRPTHLIAQCPVMGGMAAAYCARKHHIPLLVELHGTHYFKPARPGLAGRLEHWFYRLLSGYAFRRASRIRSLSDEMTRNLCASYSAELQHKVVCIPVRVDLEIFPPKTNYTAHVPLRIVNVGRLSDNKNQLQLIYDLAQGKIPVEVVLVGSGEKEAEVRGLAERLPLHVNVRVAGQLTHSQLCKVLQDSDVYVHYAKAEGTPRAIIEAMAVGLPVIVNHAGFLGDVLQDGINSFVLERPDSFLLGDRLRQLAASQAMRESMGKAGQQCVLETYEWHSVFGKYRHILRQLDYQHE